SLRFRSRPRRGDRHWRADRRTLVLVDLRPRRAPRRLERLGLARDVGIRLIERRGQMKGSRPMRFVQANGLVIHYRDQGRRDAPPVVFINSLGCDFRIWSEVAEILAPDFRIVLYDKRGHGLSESGPDKNDMADYARDLAALLDI